MRPLRLEMEGFSAFRAPTVVDFADADLVAFVGPTGSGKSSIIDAVTFALYGSVARYDDRRAVEPAIHRLCNEAKVRLDFEVAGVRHTAVRVVRRRGSSGASTKEARLYRSTADGEETLAGTERELSQAVARLLGLDFDQFTKTCVLPQGEFAEFLHEDKRDRQQLLRQLLDVGVYERMGRLARERAKGAGERARWLQEQLESDPPLDDEALVALREREQALGELAAALPGRLEQLAAARRARDDAVARAEALGSLAGQLAQLAVPTDVAELAPRLAAARQDLEAATTELERARSLRDEADEARAAGPDAAAVNAVLAAIEQVDPLRRDVEALRPQVDRALEEADRAQVAADEAAAELADADQRLAAAKDVARLGAVIAGLVVGEACPVCRQTVHELPEHDLDAELAAATGAQKASARRAREAAEEARRLSVRATEASARLGAVQEHLARIESQVPHDADVAVLRAELERAALLAQEQQKAHEAVKAAERAEARARKELQALEKHEVRLRRDLHAVRDALAARIPPALDGESLAQDWERLVEWAQQERSSVEAERDGAALDAASLGSAVEASTRAIQDSCSALGVACDAGAALQEVTRAHAATQAELRAAVERREQAARTRDEVERLEGESRLNAEMGRLLDATGFERWLLQTALDRLVTRATERLRELSGGQFSLVSEDGEFLIRDHRNADELRSVRTLSGGETFLTSLALALALSEDIAELAAEGALHIESMFLDEGFGTLDPETLDVVATAIEELSSSGRLIGIVTHIRDLADRMPVRFEVRKDAVSSRVERVEV